jgi:hypothetical protein
MILEYLKYFAQFPSKKAVNDLFSNGRSKLPEYAELKKQIKELPDSVIPDITGYVFGQRFEDVKKRVDSLTGTYLFCDFGEISSSQNNIGSITDSHVRAVTVAAKIPDSSDMVEVAIYSNRTLYMLNLIRAHMIKDARTHSWLKPITERQTIVPFVAPELQSLGWTMKFTASASDWLNVKNLISTI